MMTQMTQSAAQTDIKVLDHGHVQLVDWMGDDLFSSKCCKSII
jgi:hypothetical protein